MKNLTIQMVMGHMMRPEPEHQISPGHGSSSVQDTGLATEVETEMAIGMGTRGLCCCICSCIYYESGEKNPKTKENEVDGMKGRSASRLEVKTKRALHGPSRLTSTARTSWLSP